MSYIQQSLTKGEQVVLQARISWWSQLPLLIFGFLLLPVMGLGLLLWLIAVARYFTTEMAITNKRVIAKFGFISRRTVEINLQRIESIQVHQGLLGRLFNYGSIIVSGAGNPQAPIPGISDPLGFRRSFSESQETFAKGAPAAA
jgi:membrane protein YdbS with pleckstrin-like domain